MPVVLVSPRVVWLASVALVGTMCQLGQAQTLRSEASRAQAVEAAALVPSSMPLQALSFGQAVAALQAQSPQWAANRKAVESAQLRREAMQGLGGPTFAVTGMAYRYSAHVDVNLDPVRNALSQVLAQLPPEVAGNIAQGVQLPNPYPLQRKDSNVSGSVSALWPVYMGGLSDAVRTGLDGKSQEAQAQAVQSEHQLYSLLVQRYFTAQLAQRAATLRRRALEGVRAHDAAAQRMLEAGVIARVERLQASAALADALQQSLQADSDARLARSALAYTLPESGNVQPSTPLFVDLQPLAPLQTFQAAALQQHPGLSLVAARRTQAQALHDASEAMRKPQVLAFGMRDVNTSGKPNWVAGMAVRWTLWDSVDRDKLAAAGERSIEQADWADAQARNDIALQVEKNWLAVEQARLRYQSGQSSEELAHELLRLRSAGLKEGTSTALELIDAELQLAKVQTERASAANDYVQALSALLESAGQSADFEQYMARAHLVITSDAP